MITIKKVIGISSLLLLLIVAIFANDSINHKEEVPTKIQPQQNTQIKEQQEKNIIQKQEGNNNLPKKTRPRFGLTNQLEPLTMLLLGVERTVDEQYGRSDSIMLGLVQPKTKKLLLLSIPRDTYIEIPGYGYDKLNKAYQLGGENLTKQALSNWLEIDINESASIDYANFEKMIDIVGGLEIEVDRNMAHDEFVLNQGLQILNGKEALYFVRFRKSLDGNHDSDYKRTERQRQVLSKLADELLRTRSFKQSFQLVRSLIDTVDSTLSLHQIISYGHHFSDISSDHIQTASFQGYGKKRRGLWYEIIPDTELEEKKAMIDQFLNGKSD